MNPIFSDDLPLLVEEDQSTIRRRMVKTNKNEKYGTEGAENALRTYRTELQHYHEAGRSLIWQTGKSQRAKKMQIATLKATSRSHNEKT